MDHNACKCSIMGAWFSAHNVIRNRLSAEPCLDPLWSLQRSLDSLAWSGEGDLWDREGHKCIKEERGRQGRGRGRRWGEGQGQGYILALLLPTCSPDCQCSREWSHTGLSMKWSIRTFHSQQLGLPVGICGTWQLKWSQLHCSAPLYLYQSIKI